MPAEYSGAAVAIVGSLVGAGAVVTTAWITQKALHRRELLREDVHKRETLYGDFIGECAKLLMDALDHTLDKPATLLPAYALLNRVRLCASAPVLDEAQRLLRQITDQYFAQNLTVEELRRLAHSGTDPLQPLGEACRHELRSVRAQF